MALSALHTDLYQLTMLAGYHKHGMQEQPAAFDLFYRTEPFQGAYSVFAGLETALDYLENLTFEENDLQYLKQLGIFGNDFLDDLRAFRFSGRVTAPSEGTIVFANEPLLTVEGPLSEVQFVETALLNIINFQTLVATKASRIAQAAGEAEVIEFGLRRAQGPDGGLSVARAAAIGGVSSTSNVQAGHVFDLPVRGTHAHSWVMAFDNELSAFRAYAAAFPESCILLVDTYDTLSSGLPNALTVAKELRSSGHELKGVRLDSGDIASLSRAARQMFDQAGFQKVKIVASNELDEFEITRIRKGGGMVDVYGVGTRLATCDGPGGGALGGVYKLVELDGTPRLKTTSDPDKSTLPGRKKIWRVVGDKNRFVGDIIAGLQEEQPDDSIRDEFGESARNLDLTELRSEVMRAGKRTLAPRSLSDHARQCRNQLALLPACYQQLAGNQNYPVRLSKELQKLRDELVQEP